MSTLVSPHGSAKLRPLLLEGAEREAERTRAASLPAIQISSREAGDVVMMGIGGFTPLAGFMGYDDWSGVCDHMRMTNGVFWPIPITLSVDSATADGMDDGSDVALMDPETGSPLATMTVTEKYRIDKAHECQSVFNTTDKPHGFAIPGLDVQTVLPAGEEIQLDLPALAGGEIYRIACHLHPPHRSATLVVVPGR